MTRGEGSWVGSQDALRRVPGVTAINWRRVARAVPNLAALGAMSEEEMRPLLGKQGARKAHGFFHMEASARML